LSPSDYFYQVISVPHYRTLTVTTSISPPAFDTSTGCGGVLVLKCATAFNLSGSVNLTDKGLGDASARLLLNQESQGTLDVAKLAGHENFDTLNHFTLQKGDGAAFIVAKSLTLTDDARIGNPNLRGIARCRGAEDSLAKPTEYTNLGGSSLLLVAESINNFNPVCFAKYRSKTLEAGKGLARVYIATETQLPADEGLYSSDIINTPERLTKETLIDGFGSGSFGIAKAPTALQNNYARVSAISSDGKTFTLTNITTDGIAKFERNALVMVHATFKTFHIHEGRFFLATVVGVSNDTTGKLRAITLNHSLKELGLGAFDLTHNNFQVIALPQYSEFTLTGTNSKTPKWDGAGGIFAIAVNGTCDLSGATIDVRGKGGSRNHLSYISNANTKNRLPIGEGHGSIFILAKTLKMNSNTRLGSTASGNQFGGGVQVTSGGYAESNGGFMGKRVALGTVGKYDGFGGSAYQGGQQVNGHDGGFCSNASDFIAAQLASSGLQGASLFLVADTIDGLCLDALSTGGGGGNMTSHGQSTNCLAGLAGGCGYGGGGASFRSPYSYGGCGGVHGGGSGSSNQDDTKWSGGGGSAGFCCVYANHLINHTVELFD